MHIGISRGRDAVRERQKRVAEMVEQVGTPEVNLSSYAHECEFVTSAFWDGVNYAGGGATPSPASGSLCL